MISKGITANEYEVYVSGSQWPDTISGTTLTDAINGSLQRLVSSAGIRGSYTAIVGYRAEYKPGILGGKGGVDVAITLHRDPKRGYPATDVAHAWIYASADDLDEHYDLTDKQFSAALQEAAAYDDPDAFVSDVATSDIFGASEDELPALAAELRPIWRYAHLSVNEIVHHTGLSQTDFAARFAIPLRTLQGWISGSRECPPYVRLLLAKQCGL